MACHNGSIDSGSPCARFAGRGAGAALRSPNQEGKYMSSVLELKKKLRYMVPEIRLALIKEGRAKAKGIACPDDMEQFVEPLKFFVRFRLTQYVKQANLAA